MAGYGFPNDQENHGFVKWTRLVFKVGHSELPPEGIGNQLWQAEIINIDPEKKFFEIKFSGGELALGGLEWKTKKLPINKNSIEQINKAFLNDVWKLPNPQDQANDFYEHLKEIKEIWGWLKTDKIEAFNNLTLKGNHFVNKEGEEIQYFGTIHEILEVDQKSVRKLPQEQIINDLYEVSHNKWNNTFKLKYKTDGWLSKWGREMDYANLYYSVMKKD
jgi:hypothetical protein